MSKLRKLAIGILVIFLAVTLFLGVAFAILAEENHDGSFNISIFTEGNWQLQGKLTFSDYETLYLPLDNNAGQLKIKLEQYGHDGAFVDYVALQKDNMTYLPSSAINIDSGTCVLNKVMYPEYDVCDAWNSTLEIVWDDVPNDTTLVMRAMEEDFGEGHGSPLYYPSIKFGQTLSYTLDNDGGIITDGVLEESTEPDFTVFWQPDSPHPDGYTYGWLHCNQDYLYAAIEVTADNTLDEEDWGALYIALKGEMEEFRISDDQAEWGVSGFHYTSAVPYEHRIYEFKIPLVEINSSIGDEIQYGFGCYGTVSVNLPLINEIRVDQTGTDNDEYFELAGTPSESLNGLTYLVIGDGTGGSGVIEEVVSLTGQTIPASGYFVVAESTFSLGTADMTTDLNFENSDNVTHLIVLGFTGANGDDLDTNDDGVLDSQPWSLIVDRIALIMQDNPPTTTEYHYGPPTVGPDGAFAPGHVFRCSDGWHIGQFDPLGDDTPGAGNNCCDISGYKYLAGSDPPIGLEGWVINLEKWVNGEYFDWSPWASSNTDTDGFYCFSGLDDGQYRVTESLKPGWTAVPPSSYEITLPPVSYPATLYNFYNEPPSEADLGDADESLGYPVTYANNGAYHLPDEYLSLGDLKDYETDGQPSVSADGDDFNDTDDEDGVTFTTPLTPNQSASVNVTSNIPASVVSYLNAWIDFNTDGDWDDAGEQIITDQQLQGVLQTFNFTVPADANLGVTYARFRANNETQGIGPTGSAYGGEVEDYQVFIEGDYGDAPEPYPTLYVDDGARHLSGG
ncbi:GEVED domain-containing protein [Chloroflexota bacterium]